MRTFAEWKAVAIARLMAIRRKYADKPEILREIQNLVARIRYARLESIPAVLASVEKLLSEIPELETVVPSTDEIEAWHRNRQRGRTSQL
jgi:predicted molibdopterin-dependent oxidoreductase YjgC